MAYGFCLSGLLAALFPLAACKVGPPPEENRLVLFDPATTGLREEAAARLPGLDDAARVLLSYYAALYNTGCSEGNCVLTQALGIPSQCGSLHVRRIRRLVPDFDPLACVYLPDEASAYTWIEGMTLFEPTPDTFEVTIQTRWKSGTEEGEDIPLRERWRLIDGRLEPIVGGAGARTG